MIDGGLIHLCNEIGYFVHYNIRGHSHIIMLWCFPPFLTPPPPMLYFVMFSIMKLWFFLLISLYQNIYLISTHTILQSIFGVYPTVFPNNVVLWCIMIITLFLVPLPPPPVIKCYVLAYPLPPSGACNMGMTPKRESQLDNTFFIKSQHS